LIGRNVGMRVDQLSLESTRRPSGPISKTVSGIRSELARLERLNQPVDDHPVGDDGGRRPPPPGLALSVPGAGRRDPHQGAGRPRAPLVVARIVSELGLDQVMFEAAEPDVFSWYIKNYGIDVNLFVDHSQIVQLECLRAGIWGTQDTWGRILTYRE
jgi:hypothetical protein